MDKLEEFKVSTEIRMQQLQDQVDAQQLVIAWLLSQLDYLAPDREPPGPRFLLGQSLALSDNPKYTEYNAVFDDLAEASSRFVSARRGLHQEPQE